MFTVEVQDLSQDRKRRVVDHDVHVLVVLFLIVAAGVEWPNELLPVELVLFSDPCRDGLINDVRCVAVVGRFLWLELVQELVVLVVPFFAAGVVAVLALEPGRRLGKVESGQADVKVEVVQFRELKVDCLAIPGTELRQPVVGQNVGATLFGRQSFDVDARNGLHSELLRSQDTSVARDDVVVLVYEAGIEESELFYAPRDLFDLFFVVDLCVSLIRPEHVEAYFLNCVNFRHMSLLVFPKIRLKLLSRFF